ncbi:MAG: hypothetical protein J3K34DRAFT_526758 [Monoraphidium minutum]|nr:MAG: hypothetical protein J3K34DRAFT_526758 [Monoraphidium minutum]
MADADGAHDQCADGSGAHAVAAAAHDPMSQAAQLQAAEAIRVQMEEYVRGRIRQFARDFAREIAPGLAPDAIDAATARALGAAAPAALMPLPAAPAALQAGQGQYRLEFRHECSALGCRDGECPLCAYNPQRLCERNFQKKYLVGDPLRAKCGAALRLELCYLEGNPVTQGAPDLTIELTLLDGVAFKDRGGEGRLLSDEELRSCFRLTNHKDEPLLTPKAAGGAGGAAKGGGRSSVQIRLEGGSAVVPDLTVTDSSEALLQGRRPPFRLLAWCPDGLGGFDHSAAAAVSDDFVVATRRVKQANKADIPLVNDHVSKIEHIGRETVKKLADMRLAAQETGVDVHIDDRLARIVTVGDFQNLVRCVDADGGQLRKAMQAVLKLSREKWDEAARHALEAVHPDFRRRVWYPPGQNMGVGLVFNCKDGGVQLRGGIALAQTGPDGATKVIAEDQLDPASLEILRDLKVTAVKKWSEPRHPGWGVFTEPPDGGAPGAGGGAPPPAAAPPPGLITLGPGAALGGGRGGAKRTASQAGLDAGGGDGDGDTASAAAAAAAGLQGWPLLSGSLPALTPESLAALTAQLGAAGAAALAPPPAAGAVDADAAAAAAALAAAAPLHSGLGAPPAAPLGSLDPGLLLALQAQLAAGGGAAALAAGGSGGCPDAAAAAAGVQLGGRVSGGGGDAGGGGLGQLAALCVPPQAAVLEQPSVDAAALAAVVAAAGAAGPLGAAPGAPGGGGAAAEQQQQGGGPAAAQEGGAREQQQQQERQGQQGSQPAAAPGAIVALEEGLAGLSCELGALRDTNAALRARLAAIQLAWRAAHECQAHRAAAGGAAGGGAAEEAWLQEAAARLRAIEDVGCGFGCEDGPAGPGGGGGSEEVPTASCGGRGGRGGRGSPERRSAIHGLPHLSPGASLLLLEGVLMLTSELAAAAAAAPPPPPRRRGRPSAAAAAEGPGRPLEAAAAAAAEAGDQLHALGVAMKRFQNLAVLWAFDAWARASAAHMGTRDAAFGERDAPLAHWELAVATAGLTRSQALLLVETHHVCKSRVDELYAERAALATQLPPGAAVPWVTAWAARSPQAAPGAAGGGGQHAAAARLAENVRSERAALGMHALAFGAVLSPTQFAKARPCPRRRPRPRAFMAHAYPWPVHMQKCNSVLQHHLRFSPEVFAPEPLPAAAGAAASAAAAAAAAAATVAAAAAMPRALRRPQAQI